MVNALVGSAITNILINIALAWWSVRHVHAVPLWRVPTLNEPSSITDTIGTFFFLPLMTTLVCTTTIRDLLRRDEMPALPFHLDRLHLHRLPTGRLRRGAVLGAVSVIALFPVALLALWAANFDHVSQAQFIAYKALLAVALGVIVTPLIALCAMADEVAPA